MVEEASSTTTASSKGPPAPGSIETTGLEGGALHFCSSALHSNRRQNTIFTLLSHNLRKLNCAKQIVHTAVQISRHVAKLSPLVPRGNFRLRQKWKAALLREPVTSLPDFQLRPTSPPEAILPRVWPTRSPFRQ